MADNKKDAVTGENNCDNTTECLHKEDDPELDELLDSALEDFRKPAFVNNIPRPETKQQPKPDSPSKGAGEPAAGWEEEFLKQAAGGFDEAMQALMDEDPETAQDFKKFAEMASKAVTGDVSDEELNILTQGFLTGLAVSGRADEENKPAPVSQEELSKIFSNLGETLSSTGDDDTSDTTLLMKNMMQALLSKDLLYPALRDITDKYPDWLAVNRQTLDPAQYEKYNTQYQLMKEVCDEFDSEQEGDSQEARRLRFEKILEKMQKMQECGHPPADLVGDVETGLDLDEHGLPKIPNLAAAMGTNDKCSIM